MSLDGISDEIAHGIWKVLGWHQEFDDLEAAHFLKLQRAIQNVLDGFVFRYNRCGSESICNEGLSPADWNKRETASTPSCAGEERLILEVESDPQEVVSDMSSQVLRALFTRSEHVTAVAPIVREIDTIIKHTLGPYLFRSPSCGVADICKNRCHVSPWGDRAKTA